MPRGKADIICSTAIHEKESGTSAALITSSPLDKIFKILSKLYYGTEVRRTKFQIHIFNTPSTFRANVILKICWATIHRDLHCFEMELQQLKGKILKNQKLNH